MFRARNELKLWPYSMLESAMADPTKYAPEYSFSTYQASKSKTPLPANSIAGSAGSLSITLLSRI